MTDEERDRLTALTIARLDMVVDRYEAATERLELLLDLLSKKLFEKAINKMIDEEQQRQSRAKDPSTTGGFNLAGRL